MKTMFEKFRDRVRNSILESLDSGAICRLGGILLDSPAGSFLEGLIMRNEDRALLFIKRRQEKLLDRMVRKAVLMGEGTPEEIREKIKEEFDRLALRRKLYELESAHLEAYRPSFEDRQREEWAKQGVAGWQISLLLFLIPMKEEISDV